jgi:4-hydroxy-tetrahydrodipicolinate synthase
MVFKNGLSGVFAAAVTPLDSQANLILDDWLALLEFLGQRGCHGALLCGTTGEGPSFTTDERLHITRTALQIRQIYPDFHLLVGTGTPSLEETVVLTRQVYNLGVDAVVVLPPYFFRNVTDNGLFEWFSKVIRQAVPGGSAFLLYHLPSVVGISISFDLIARLIDSFPNHVIGIKDSSTDPEFARQLGDRFSDSLLIFSGTDNLFEHALENFACGCITALANLRSPDLRLIWDGRSAGMIGSEPQLRLTAARKVMNRFPPNPPLYKALLHRIHGFPLWGVRPPLVQIFAEQSEQILAAALSEVDGFAS